MGKRWIKLWVHESLEGTIRFDFSPEERGVFYDLLLLAGRCRREGVIAPSEGATYPHRWIAGTLNISEELLERTLKKCLETQRIKENSNGIEIINWARYQSEYDRQKPYREDKKDRAAERQREYDDPNSILGHPLEDVKAILTGGDPAKAKAIPEHTKQLWRRELKRKGIPLKEA